MGEASKRRAASARTSGSAPTVPMRLMASARSVGVRSLSPGMASKPSRRCVGPMSARTAWWSASSCSASAIRLVRTNALPTGDQAAGSGSSPSREARTRNSSQRGEAGQGGGPGVGDQVGPLQRSELGQVLGQRRPVRGLVADPEDAPAAGVDHGEALSGLGDRLGFGIEDEVAHRRAGLAVGGQRPHRDGDAPLLPDGRGRAGGAPVPSAKGCWLSASPCSETSGCPPCRMNVSMTSRTGAPLASSSASHRSLVTVFP